MFRSHVQRVFAVLVPGLFLNFSSLWAADSKASASPPVDKKTTQETTTPNTTENKTAEESATNQDAEKEKKEPEAKPSAFELFVNNKAALSSSFGIIRAYKNQDLRANGFADLKGSYLLSTKKKLYLTAHYLPFAIGPDSDPGTIYGQSYAGIVETYALGLNVDLSFMKFFDFMVSGELGVFRSHFTELVAVKHSSPPLSRFGALVLVGAECMFKPFDKIRIGPRFSLGAGSLKLWSFAINSSFYF